MQESLPLTPFLYNNQHNWGNEMKKKVLIVDDEKDIVEFLTSYLKRRDFDVISTDNGKEVMDLIKKHSPDIAILDLNIEGQTGIETLHCLRKEKLNIKVIVQTGLTFSDIDDEIIQNDFVVNNNFFHKPVLVESLYFAICKLLNIIPEKSDHSNPPEPTQRNAQCTIISRKEILHKLSNCHNIIKNKCEDFTFSYEEGFYKEKSKDELGHLAYDFMRKIMEVVDKAAATADLLDEKNQTNKEKQ